MRDIAVSPSLLSSDFSAAGEAVCAIEEAGAHFIHFDVMDGDFVPNITFGSKFVEDVRPFSKLPFDVHLMTRRPPCSQGALPYPQSRQKSGACNRTVNTRRGSFRSVTTLKPRLCDDREPRLRRQSLIAETLKKVRVLSQMRTEGGHKFLISVDGGIKLRDCSERDRSGKQRHSAYMPRSGGRRTSPLAKCRSFCALLF